MSGWEENDPSDPMGGAAGEAYANTLKSAGLTAEHLLAREAIQNSVDAGLLDAKVLVVFREREFVGEAKEQIVDVAGHARIERRRAAVGPRDVKARHVLDPFAGRANFAAAAAQVPRVRAIYCEISPVYQFIAESRNRALLCRSEVRESIAQELIAGISSPITDDLARCAAIEAMTKQDLREQLRNAAEFVRNELPLHAPVHRIADDARTLALLQPLEIDCVITNPPSLNFAAYATPEAMRLIGARRARVRKLQPPTEALERMRRVLGNNINPIRDDVARLQCANPRMARIAANYFADMAESFAAIASQMTSHAHFAIEVEASTLASVAVDTPRHLESMLGVFGFSNASHAEHFRLLAR